MNSQPRVLIIVLLYNSAEYIGELFSSLAKISYPQDSFEILVIDNASSDNTVGLIRTSWPKVTIIENQKNLGFTVGNNFGFKYAADHGFDYAYLLNPDTVVEPDFLQPVVSLAESDQTIGAVQSKLLLYSDKSKVNSIGNEIHYLGFGYTGGHQTVNKQLEVKEITYPSGAATLFSVQALKQVGYFNEDLFIYHEDLDLGWRFWLQGFKCMLAPQSVVYHKYDFSRSILKYYYMERNRSIVALQNYKIATLVILFPAWLAMELGLLGFSFSSGFWKEKLKAYQYFLKLSNIKKILHTRKEIQAQRKVGDRAVIKRFTGKILFQDISNPVLTYIANPIFNLYWQLTKFFIWW